MFETVPNRFAFHINNFSVIDSDIPYNHTQLVGIDLPKPNLIRFEPIFSPSNFLIALTTLLISEYWINAYDDTIPCFLISISYHHKKEKNIFSVKIEK